MCVAANSQHANLDIDKTTLDSFYEWLEGPEFGNHPQHKVPLARLRAAEREAWRKICLKVHERVPLSKALQEVRTDYLFWTPILMGEDTGNKMPNQAQGASTRSQTPKGKGKGKKNGEIVKGKGKSMWRPKGKGKRSNNSWAKSDSAGREYCWKWNQGNCRGNCNRIHRCCAIKPNGWTCNGKHPAHACTSS